MTKLSYCTDDFVFISLNFSFLERASLFVVQQCNTSASFFDCMMPVFVDCGNFDNHDKSAILFSVALPEVNQVSVTSAKVRSRSSKYSINDPILGVRERAFVSRNEITLSCFFIWGSIFSAVI